MFYREIFCDNQIISSLPTPENLVIQRLCAN